jgi:hypothetical protein
MIFQFQFQNEINILLLNLISFLTLTRRVSFDILAMIVMFLFLNLLKFFVQNVSHIADHFHQFHLRMILD